MTVMTRERARIHLQGFTIALIACLTASPAIGAAAAIEVPLRDLPMAVDRDLGRGAKRQRFVAFDLGLVEQMRGRTALEQSFTLDLFDDVSALVVFDRAEVLDGDGSRRILHGRIDRQPESHVVAVVRPGRVTANISLADGRQFTISHAGSGVHRIQEVDPADFSCGTGGLQRPAELAEEPIDTGPGTTLPQLGVSANALGASGPDTGSVIDLMVVYTPGARGRFGDTEGIEDKIDTAVEATNDGYIRSGVTQRLRLVHTEEVTYTENGRWEFVKGEWEFWHAQEAALEDVTDGVGDVHALRNTHGADQVSLFVNVPGTNIGGIAWTPQTYSYLLDAGGAFSVVNVDNATFVVLAHELAHNQGAEHDPDTFQIDEGLTRAQFETFANTAVEWKSFGYCDPQGDFATAMAYGHNCNPEAPNAMLFSNPELSLNGSPTGDEWSDVRMTLNETYPIAVNWRQRPLAAPELAAPVLVRPSGTVNTRTPSFLWNTVSGAGTYGIEVVDATGEVIYSKTNLENYFDCGGAWGESCSIPSGYYPTGPNLENGSYRWRVMAANDENSSWSEWMDFQVLATVPAPVPLAPSGLVEEERPAFVWKPVPGAFKYELYFDIPGLATPRVFYPNQAGCDQTGANCSIQPLGSTPPRGLPDGNYRWGVRAYTADGVSPWAELDFQISLPPELLTPADWRYTVGPWVNFEFEANADFNRSTSAYILVQSYGWARSFRVLTTAAHCIPAGPNRCRFGANAPVYSSIRGYYPYWWRLRWLGENGWEWSDPEFFWYWSP